MKLSNLFRRKPSREVAKDRSENPADFRPRQLLARNSGDDQKRYRRSHITLYENRHKQYGNPDQQSVDAGQGGEDPFDLRQHPDSGSP